MGLKGSQTGRFGRGAAIFGFLPFLLAPLLHLGHLGRFGRLGHLGRLGGLGGFLPGGFVPWWGGDVGGGCRVLGLRGSRGRFLCWKLGAAGF